ncbi:response regulator [Trinickia dinghuensis]|uniref:DNA-binding response regulator n=1 Tax=Trinickia dinghuensis TaxID=2291023 RepID=A0A3D8K5C3_9BURK|nr:response regulator transcription factor [Trinickia dinghuensis]RDV00420.1 DNA-binding response regulator [Trinickia dinghuensis]
MIKILIADDHAVVRSGLKQIVATAADMTVIDEAASGADVLSKLRGIQVDLLMLDITMPGISGVDLIRRVYGEYPEMPILILSIHNEPQVVSRALRAGASGYVTKDSDPEVLLAAIRKLVTGGRFIDPTLVDAVVFERHSSDLPPHEILSDREFEVLRLLASGRSVNDIAEAFALSAKTISTHKRRLMQKLGVSNNAELFRYSIRHGLAAQ